ncbi:MAG: type II toxin-antitoxin system RelE/ParE family toxin, partial [Gemmataceae bacterium]
VVVPRNWTRGRFPSCPGNRSDKKLKPFWQVSSAGGMEPVLFHSSAREEYLSAVRWYKNQSLVAADNFVREVERVIAGIEKTPTFFAIYEPPFRQAPLRRFPYVIIFRIDAAGNVIIFAIAHVRREPGYWLSRVSPDS